MTQDPAIDWPALVDELNRLLRLKTTPIGMKLFERVEDMQAIPKIRRPKAVHTTDQSVAQAARLGFTIGITREDLVGAQCGAVIGLHPQDEDWLSGQAMAGVWFATVEDSPHQSQRRVFKSNYKQNYNKGRKGNFKYRNNNSNNRRRPN